MIENVLRPILGLVVILCGLWLVGRAPYMMPAIPAVSVVVALFGLLAMVIGLALMVKPPWSP